MNLCRLVWTRTGGFAQSQQCMTACTLTQACQEKIKINVNQYNIVLVYGRMRNSLNILGLCVTAQLQVQNLRSEKRSKTSSVSGQ